MKLSEFVSKCCSRYLWLNLIAMVGVVALLCVFAKVGLDLYTHHGQTVEIPDVRHKSMVEARSLLEKAGLDVEVTDTGYIKELPADCVLEQSPMPGMTVKPGHRISIIVNAPSTPTLSLPDIVDNCSAREAMAKLRAMGFKVGLPIYVQGEKDWVYGVTVDGQTRSAGDKIPISKTIVLQVGNGLAAGEDSLLEDYNIDGNNDPGVEGGDIDQFVEVQ